MWGCEMEEKEPITDKVNFPEETLKAMSEAEKLSVNSTIAYYDGVSDGYRQAVKDFLAWSLVFFVVAMLLGRLNATD